MRLLFVSTNRLRRIMTPMPLGLASIIAQLDESQHQIEVLDLMFADDPRAALHSLLTDFEPELIGLSIRNIDNQCYLQTEYFLPEVKELIELCREHSTAPIVIGGPAFTVSPTATLEFLQADFGVIGEGEKVFGELVERIAQGADCSDLPGLVWPSEGGVRANPPQLIEDLDSLQPPRIDLFEPQRYAAEGGASSVISKQGCTFRCLYCDSPHVMGSRWRKKSPERVAGELESLQREMGGGLVFFTDAVFNHPPDYAKKICEAIIRRGLDISWIATVHPAFAQRDLFERMRDAGCRAVSVGCDTASARMLEILRKDFTLDQLDSALDLLEELQIQYVLSVLVGAPGENRETIEETIEFLSDRNPLMLDFCVGIRLMPHTALFDMAVQEGVISADDPLMEPKFYLSPQVADWIEEYLTEICSQRPSWSIAYQHP